jgi:hypothetical protein
LDEWQVVSVAVESSDVVEELRACEVALVAEDSVPEVNRFSGAGVEGREADIPS